MISARLRPIASTLRRTSPSPGSTSGSSRSSRTSGPPCLANRTIRAMLRSFPSPSFGRPTIQYIGSTRAQAPPRPPADAPGRRPSRNHAKDAADAHRLPPHGRLHSRRRCARRSRRAEPAGRALRLLRPLVRRGLFHAVGLRERRDRPPGDRGDRCRHRRGLQPGPPSGGHRHGGIHAGQRLSGPLHARHRPRRAGLGRADAPHAEIGAGLDAGGGHRREAPAGRRDPDRQRRLLRLRPGGAHAPRARPRCAGRRRGAEVDRSLRRDRGRHGRLGPRRTALCRDGQGANRDRPARAGIAGGFFARDLCAGQRGRGPHRRPCAGSAPLPPSIWRPWVRR